MPFSSPFDHRHHYLIVERLWNESISDYLPIGNRDACYRFSQPSPFLTASYPSHNHQTVSLSMILTVDHRRSTVRSSVIAAHSPLSSSSCPDDLDLGRRPFSLRIVSMGKRKTKRRDRKREWNDNTRWQRRYSVGKHDIDKLRRIDRVSDGWKIEEFA